MNAHANTTSFANTDIIIENVFSYDDVLKLSGLCNYEPFCDEPEAEDLIQLAAFTKDTHCLVGFISCLNPIINCNTDDSDDIDTHNNSDTIKPSIYDDIVIEFTAMTDPDYRQQHIFTSMFYALMCTINALISDSNIKYITAIDDKTANSIISHKHNPACNISSNINIAYACSEYLMELSIKHITNNFSTVLPDTIELLKYDDEYQLLSSASDELISSISFEHFNTHICIHDVWTDPDMRRCGYARLLLTELIQDWKNDSLNNSHDNTIIPLILHVSGSNMPAVSLYKSSGFVVREELKYYNVK